MRHGFVTLTLTAALLFPQLPAQGQEDFDAFGIEADSATLDEVSPDDGSLPPPMPAPEDGGSGPAAGVATVAPAQAGPAPGTESAVAQIEPPADWQHVTFHTLTASVPPGWVVAEESDDILSHFKGDMASRQGAMIGFALERESNILPPGAVITVDRQVTLDGRPFRLVELSAALDADNNAEMILLISGQPVEDDDYLLIHGTAVGAPLARYRDEIEAMLGTVRLAEAPPPEPNLALGGLLTWELDATWNVLETAAGDHIGLWPRIYSGYIGVARGDAVDGRDGLDAEVPPGAPVAPTEILGQPADRYRWDGIEPEFQNGGRMVPGRFDYYRLRGCAGDDPVAVKIAGAPEYVDSAELAAALRGLALNLPDGLGPCAADGPLAAGSELTQDQPAAGTQGAAPDVSPVPRPAPHGIPVDVEGVSFILPEGWTANYDSPGDKIFASPDGRWSLLSFWWFPDEPLLGYDDIAAVENVVVDHEPVTRIFSAIGERRSIQNVTERARADKKRFIFTLEGEGASEAELAALHDQLIATLRLQGGFDPSKRGDAVPAPVPVTPSTASAQSAGDLSSQAPQPAAQAGWTTYVNERFGTTIEYPAAVFQSLSPPDNGDGLSFASADGTATLLVFGQHNFDGLDARSMLSRDREWGAYEQVAYETAGADGYVISGSSGDDIFYRQAVIDAATDLVHVFEVTYPQADRDDFEALVTRMAKSFGHR